MRYSYGSLATFHDVEEQGHSESGVLSTKRDVDLDTNKRPRLRSVPR